MLWRFWSPVLTGIAAFVLVASYVGVSASSAYACNTTYVDEFDGVQTKEIVTNGAEAYVERYNPRTCEGASSAWPGILNTACSSTDFAQVGWADWFVWGIKPHYFYEYSECGKQGAPMAISLVPKPEEHGFDHYAVYTQNSEKEVLFTINSEAVKKLALTWKANKAEYAAEVFNLGDQVPGDTSHHFKFYGLNHLYKGGWYSDNAKENYKVKSEYGGTSFENGNYFYTWDKRYSTEE